MSCRYATRGIPRVCLFEWDNPPFARDDVSAHSPALDCRERVGAAERGDVTPDNGFKRGQRRWYAARDRPLRSEELLNRELWRRDLCGRLRRTSVTGHARH